MSAVRKTRVAVALLGLAGSLALAPSSALARPADPPGNNGTVKIDARPFDDAPNNEPHVGCSFQVDFYGYDKGNTTPRSPSVFSLPPAVARCS